jgi:hypothetical protein
MTEHEGRARASMPSFVEFIEEDDCFEESSVHFPDGEIDMAIGARGPQNIVIQ